MPPIASSTLLALALITSPGELKVKEAPDPFVLAALQKVGVALELLDPREIKYTFVIPSDFETDLKYLRIRYQEINDAPWESDSRRFPDIETCRKMMSLNSEYQDWLKEQIKLDKVDTFFWREALVETEYLRSIWSDAADAQCEYYYVSVRRKALKDLREKIGLCSYYGGFMPPHVPVWRFGRIDD